MRHAPAPMTPVLFLLLLGAAYPSAAQPRNGSALSPQLFNLAEGRDIWATATCGEGAENEMYCVLADTNMEYEQVVGQVVQGQVCDYCNPRDSRKSHPARNAIDGTLKWWQSPPLSRGARFNEVNLTINLGQDFHVAYVFITMGISPRPGVWALERSVDDGRSYTPWQYFASDESECRNFFGSDVQFSITADDSVICETKYSNVLPFKYGEIHVPLIKNRPSQNNFSASSALQEWSRATNIRLRLMRTKTLLAHLMHMEQQDPTVTRRYFYSIRSIEIGGRCVCNGHADTCDMGREGSKLRCRCQHNTDGEQCELCKPLYNQLEWQPAKIESPNKCEKCNCHEHADECVYVKELELTNSSMDMNGDYRGGGQCLHCKHNTDGVNCEKCIKKYYKQPERELTDVDLCARCPCPPTGADARRFSGECDDLDPRCKCDEKYVEPNCDKCKDDYYNYPECRECDCFRNGTTNGTCHIDGPCPCKVNFGGDRCKQCAPGYYGFPECKPCKCDPENSVKPECDLTTGNCMCSEGFGGRECTRCKNGYFNYPKCDYCGCSTSGVEEQVCSIDTGKCICKKGYKGDKCNQCSDEYFGYDKCQECDCAEDGVARKGCTNIGRCYCKMGFAGDKCDRCAAGYYEKSKCNRCGCDYYGSDGVSCTDDGVCTCKYNFIGLKCGECAPGYYTYPICHPCKCNPDGVKSNHTNCEARADKGPPCVCKERVTGRSCNECKPLYFNLRSTTDGCEDCRCDTGGTISSIAVCNPVMGQCHCKPHLENMDCRNCITGTYNPSPDNIFGCVACDCNTGGTQRKGCNATGGCTCRASVTGKHCDEPAPRYYVPALHQFKYELEDGRSLTRDVVRQGHDENAFPEFSWKGYAVFTDVQPKVVVDVDIRKDSLHYVILRYVNLNETAADVVLNFISHDYDRERKSHKIKLPSSNTPTFFVVKPFTQHLSHLTRGRWTVEIEAKSSVMMDYLVMMPREYFTASAQAQEVTTPCQLVENNRVCQRMAYPPLRGSVETLSRNVASNTIEVDHKIKNVANRFAVLAKDKNLDLELKPFEAPSIFLIEYISKERDNGEFRPSVSIADVVLELKETSTKATVSLPYCRYNFLCRQAILDTEGRVLETAANWDLKGEKPRLRFSLNNDDEAHIYRVVAVPKALFKMDMLKLATVCYQDGDKCVGPKYTNFPRKVMFEQGEVSVNLDEDFEDTSANVVEISPTNALALLEGTIDASGEGKPTSYIVHYYQPNHENFTANVLLNIDGTLLKGKISFAHCPSTTGCRAEVLTEKNRPLKTHQSGKYRLEIHVPEGIENDEMLIAKHLNQTYDTSAVGPYGHAYLNYAVAETGISQKDRVPLPYDHATKFLKECTQNSFYMDPKDTSEYCKKGVFTITNSFNTGSLPCECSARGSKDFKCEKFGGQCSCRDHVIGRTCTSCKPGYYGFPDCKKCNCPPNAKCNEITGVCRCPPNVEGDNCDRCAPLYYDYNSDDGCAPCNCSSLGIKSDLSDLQCDLFTGQCRCKENIGGRTCDQCVPGYYNYPYCKFCGCDHRGVNGEKCDKTTAQCFCKDKVEGVNCDSCRNGYFGLEEANPMGCMKCFCSGKTYMCQPGPMKRTTIVDLLGWTAVMVNATTLEIIPDTEFDVSLSVDETALVITGGAEATDDSLLYLKAPESYLGNRLPSYGGYIKFSVASSINSDDEKVAITNKPDIIFKGQGNTIVHIVSTDAEENSIKDNLDNNVSLTELSFTTSLSNEAFTIDRNNFMNMLSNLQTALLRVSYFKKVSNIAVTVEMSDAIRSPDEDEDSPDRIKTVEECQCPLGYKGLSCEDCDKGFYRSGPHCKSCNCSGNAQDCDVNTGVCINCENNTTGDHCELCVGGFYSQTPYGQPISCGICPCPLPNMGNNFADYCEHEPLEPSVKCVCKTGYTGNRCEHCSTGYFGDPNFIGGSCNPCFCNENNDLTVEGNCDKTNGTCLCRKHTTGDQCEYCEDWYHGDAITLKNCEKCGCHRPGSVECDKESGTCKCKENVVGDNCSSCATDHWGMDEPGNGCIACNCSVASRSTKCDLNSGKCTCMPGVRGDKCDLCEHGFYNYTLNGCQRCKCDVKLAKGMGCDQETGQCKCLPGVIGETCLKCPDRMALIENVGCFTCDVCVHNLLDETDELSVLMFVMNAEVEGLNATALNNKKLESLQSTIGDIRSQLEETKKSMASDELANTRKQLEDFESRMSNLQSNDADMDNLASDMFYNGTHDHDELVRLLGKAKEVTRQINDYRENLESHFQQVNVPVLEAEASNHRKRMEDISKSTADLSLDSNTEFTIASTFPETLKSDILKLKPYLNQIEKYNETNEAITKMIELLEKAQILQDSTRTTVLHATNKVKMAKENNNIESLIEETYNKRSETNRTFEEIDERLQNTQQILDEIKPNADKLKEIILQSSDKSAAAKIATAKLKNEESELRKLVQDADLHARRLESRVTQTTTALYVSNSNAEYYMEAATRYKDISGNITESNETLDDIAKKLADNRNVEENTKEVSSNFDGSRELKFDADTTEDGVIELKGELNVMQRSLNDVSAIQKGQRDQLDKIIRDATLTGLLIPEMVGITKVNERVANAQNITNTVSEKLKDGSSKAGKIIQRFKGFDEAKKNTEEAFKQLHKLRDLQAKLIAIDRSKKMFDEIQKNVTSTLERLREKIQETRGIADNIPIGVKLNGKPQSYLKYTKPSALKDIQARTQISFYLNASVPDGALLYIGPGKDNGREKRADPEERRNTIGEYLLIKLQRNNIAVEIALDENEPPQTIVNSRYIEYHVLYLIKLHRIGKSIEITVRREGDRARDKDTVTTQKLGGESFVFNVEPTTSIYIGHAPEESNVEPFYGGITAVIINGVPVGLWNYRERGADRPRGFSAAELTEENGSDDDWHRFNGGGYMVLDKKPRHNFRKDLDLSLVFKTYAPDALLFLYHNSTLDRYLCLQINNGRLELLYNFGDHSNGTLIINELVNTGNETLVHVTVNNSIIVLQLTSEERKNSTATMSADSIRFKETSILENLSDRYLLGGTPISEKKTVYEGMVNTTFEGCMSKVQISGDLAMSIRNKLGVRKGCRQDMVRTLSLKADGDGTEKHKYLMFEKEMHIQGQVSITFRFQTKEKNGLIFFAKNGDPIDTQLVIALVDGKITVLNKPGEEIATGPYINLVDGKWHYVAVTLSKQKVTIMVDDEHRFDKRPKGQVVNITSPFYFGGIEDTLAPKVHVGYKLITHQFTGCIANFAIDDEEINFAEGKIHGVTLSSCKAVVAEKTPDHNAEAVNDPSCFLALKPTIPYEVNFENSYRYGARPHTRSEYELESPSSKQIMRSQSVVELEFKIGDYYSNGTLFLVSQKDPPEVRSFDYIIIYMTNGRIKAQFDLGGGPAIVQIMGRNYNDGKYHRLKFERRSRNAKITVDDENGNEASAPVKSEHLDFNDIFVGGMPEMHTKIFRKKLSSESSSFTSFPGCIRDVQVNSKNILITNSVDAVLPCSNMTYAEDGAFFGYSTGKKLHLQIFDSYDIKMDTYITMKIKARKTTAILAFIGNSEKDDFMSLEIINGTIFFKLMAEGKFFYTQVESKTGLLCDGNWHKISINLFGTVITVGLEDQHNYKMLPFALMPSTNTPIYLGGLPRGVKKRQLQTTESFAGCIKDFYAGRFSEYPQTSSDKHERPFRLNIRKEVTGLQGEVYLSTCYNT